MQFIIKKSTITIHGQNNRIILNDMSQLNNIKIIIYGNNNIINIGKFCYLQGCTLWCEDDNNVVILSEHTYIHNNTEIAVTEGKKCILGKDCLLSSDIKIRTGDSHTIYDIRTQKRVNEAKDIIIGDHVWIGNKVIILKGTKIAKNCIVATGAILTNQYNDENCCIGGIPARVIKKNINWNADRNNDER